MDPMQIFWLFFMLTALQPVIKKRLLEASRKRLIARIERERQSRVVLLVHCQETMSLLGFSVFRYIDVDDSEEVIRAIHLTDPEIPLDLVLHMPGGLVLAATQIARAVIKYKGKVTVFVPHYAMSGGTLIALAADGDYYVRARGTGTGRPADRPTSRRFDSKGGTSETGRRGGRPDVNSGR
jgi:ClpP class serine protease